MVKVLIKKLDQKVEIPSYKTDGASGMDLMAFINKPIKLWFLDALFPLGNSFAYGGLATIKFNDRDENMKQIKKWSLSTKEFFED